MAVSYLSGASVVSGGSFNASSGSNRALIFHGGTNIGSDSITAVTWNGEAFTKLGAAQGGGGNRFSSLWYLYPSGTGSQTVTITGTSTNTEISLFNGVSSVAGFASAADNATTGSVLLSGGATDWLVGGAISDAGNVTATGNTVVRTSTGASIVIADSNGTASPTQLSYSFPSGNFVLTATKIIPAPVALTLTATVMSLTMALNNVALPFARKLFVDVLALVMSFPTDALVLFRKWQNQTKNSTSQSNQTKN